MDPKDFCYWLQGFFELTNPKNLTEHQVQMINDHLKLVFNKVTPDRKPSIKIGEVGSMPPYMPPTMLFHDPLGGLPICSSLPNSGCSC